MSQAGLLSGLSSAGQALHGLRQPLRQLLQMPRVRRSAEGTLYEAMGSR